MQPVRPDEVLDLVAWERVREAERARIIALKRRRRVSLGDRLSLLFENRDTLLYQIQEMVRAERIVDPGRLAEELAVYNPLLPSPGGLSATLFVEIPDVARRPPREVRAELLELSGVERALVLELGGGLRCAGEPERRDSREQRMAAVQYLGFRLDAAARRALARPELAALLAVEHPRCAARTTLSAELRAELLADLGEPSAAGLG